jgi:hypothetical protein
MAHKVILPPKKNNIPQFLKQRDINSYYLFYYLKRGHPPFPLSGPFSRAYKPLLGFLYYQMHKEWVYTLYMTPVNGHENEFASANVKNITL